MPNQLLSHFAVLRFTAAYWQDGAQARSQFQTDFLAAARRALACFELYQAFPMRSSADFLLWSTHRLDDAPAEEYFSRLSGVLAPFRAQVELVDTLWGFTRPSDYARGKSAQELDPFSPERKKFLVVYPFQKSADWYKLSRDARQGMMNEHIRIGHQYGEITQMLLYSTGLQDHEFVVVYETEDLPRFSSLVAELRGSEARRYTDHDTPVYTVMHHPTEETLRLFA